MRDVVLRETLTDQTLSALLDGIFDEKTLRLGIQLGALGWIDSHVRLIDQGVEFGV